MTKQPRYWYIAHCTTLLHTHVKLEGGLSADNEYAAMGIVRQESTMWAVKEIESIAIYSIDNHGALHDWDKPVLEQIYDLNSSPKLLQAPEKKEDAIAAYMTADWVEDTDIQTSYTTVTLKE